MEPEWACWPVKRTAWRSTPKVPSTTPERQVHALEDGALLDVQLQVGDGVLELPARLVDPVEVDAVLGEGVGQGDAVPVLEVAHVVGLEGAGGGARAEEAAPEAGALLVGPVHEPQGHGALLRGEDPA